MKSLSQLSLIILMALLFTQCTKEDTSIEPVVEATILGEWKLEGFDNTRYHFTEDRRYTIYKGGDGEWPTLEEWLAENPNIPSHEWHYDGDEVVLDLHFGNVFRSSIEFTCGGNVLNWTTEDGEPRSAYFRVDHDFDSCN